MAQSQGHGVQYWPMPKACRAVFFSDDAAESVCVRLRRDGFEADVSRGRFAGEDDDEDQPWVVLSDAPVGMLELLVEQHDGWLEHEPYPSAAGSSGARPLDLPTAPRRAHRGVGGPL